MENRVGTKIMVCEWRNGLGDRCQDGFNTTSKQVTVITSVAGLMIRVRKPKNM